MGLRDLFRKHKKDHHNVPCPSDTDKTKIQQPRQQQEHQKNDNCGITCLDVSAPV